MDYNYINNTLVRDLGDYATTIFILWKLCVGNYIDEKTFKEIKTIIEAKMLQLTKGVLNND